ncbi:glycerophosphodiester phosphodiesterase family protein [Pseudomonadota bacterium]
MGLSLLIRRLRANWRTLLFVHLLFTLIGITLITPLFGLLFRGLLAMSGSVAVADQEIALLLLSPLGMSSAVLLAGVFMAIIALELGALLAVAVGANHGTWTTPLEATRYALRHALPLLWLTLGLTVRILAYLLPFLAAVGAIAWYLLTEYDINYYLSEHPPEFYLALAVSVVFLVLLVWRLGRRLLRWSIVLPLLLFGGIAPGKIFRESELLTLNRERDILRALLLWLAAAAMSAMVPALVVGVCGGWIVGTGFDSLTPLVLLLAALALVWSVLNFFASALMLSSFSFLVADLYDRLGPPLSDQFVDAELHDGNERLINWKPSYVVFCVIVVAIAAVFAGRWVLEGVNPDNDTLVVAHRGAAGSAPENTLASVRRAIADGADWVEIDVQESRDGHVVVIHDSDFMKLAGDPLKVWDGDLAEIQKIDVGGWFGEAFAGERVPTLQQVLEEIRGRSKLLIELKYYGHDQTLEQRVVDIVEAAGMAEDIVVMSLDREGIQKLQALRPDWVTGLLAATALGDLTRVEVDFLAVNAGMASAGFIQRTHAAGKKVLVWTINDAASLYKWMSMGVDGVITDEPALAREVLAERAELSPAQRLLLSAALYLGKPPPANGYRDDSP